MSQTSTRVGWNGGLGCWAERQCRAFMDFALYYSSGAIRGRAARALRPYNIKFVSDPDYPNGGIHAERFPASSSRVRCSGC